MVTRNGPFHAEFLVILLLATLNAYVACEALAASIKHWISPGIRQVRTQGVLLLADSIVLVDCARLFGFYRLFLHCEEGIFSSNCCVFHRFDRLHGIKWQQVAQHRYV